MSREDRSRISGAVSTADTYATFLHLGAPKVELYRSILRAFNRAKEHFEISLRPAEIAEWLPLGSNKISEGELLSTLEQLRTWGNLEASQDVSEVRTVEEFNKPRYLYQFTAAGEATEQALAFFDQHCLRPGELQSTALRDILSTLEDLSRLLASEVVDIGKAVRALNDLTDRFHELATRAQSFMRSVQSSIDAPSSEVDFFVQNKEALLNYLERFVGELTLTSYRIGITLRKIESADIDHALERAAALDIADALQPDERMKAAAYEQWQLRWQGLRRWFLDQPGAPSQAKILRARARAAIPALLETVRRLNDKRASRSDRATDFLTLARWFASAPTDDDLHRLWRAAFALTSARHLRVNEETLSAWEEEGANARTSWSAAPPFFLTPRLRELGRVTPRGPIPAIIDRSNAKAQLNRLVEEEEARALAARLTLATGQTRRLSELPRLTEQEMDLLLDLLGQALASQVDGRQTAEAASEDGSLLIRLAPPEPSGSTAVVDSDAGTLEGPDFTVTIRDVAEPLAAVLSADSRAKL